MAAAEERMKKINEKLNFLSSKFHPLTALYNSKLQPPVPNIHVFNNLLEYTNAIREGKIKPSEYKPSESHCSSTEAASRTRNLKPEYKQGNNKKLKERLKAMSESGGSGVGGAKLDKKRRGRIDDAKLKEFLLVEETFKAKQTAKKRMNVMQKMEAYTEGPHSLLLKCISERRRVRVWTRRYKGLRSVLAGYLVAFDKHMNMALLDVDEVYTIEQRINQEANGVSPSSKTTKKKKKKKTKAVLGNELPCELAGTVEISLPTSALDTGELDLCTKEGKRGRSSDRNSPKGFLPVQPITSKQSSKESVSTCKKEHCQISASGNDVAASSDCATITDLPLNGNESMLPSAQSLSIALRASVSGVDGDLLQLTEVRLTDTVLDNATELETVMGQNDCSLATREENRASNTSWNAKLIEKIKKDKQESNKLANREGFDNKERETGDVKDLNSCSFSNAVSGDVSNAIINNNTKQGQGLQFRTKGSCLSPNGMELFRDNEIADYHTSMPIENSQQLMAIGKEDKFIKIPDTERSWDSQHDAHEKSLLQMDAETHKIDIKDLCHFRENCLNKKDFVVCCSEKDDSSNSDIVTFLRSSSIVSTKAVASFSTKGETVMHSAETQLNERASNGSCKHANLAHYSADYEFIRSETSLCRGPVSSASCFALCSEGAIVIPNEVRKEPGSPSKPKIETTSIDAQFSEVVSNTEEHSISRYHEGKEDKCLFHKKDQHDLELASCATELQDDELQEDYHSITQVTQMFSEPKEDGASVKLEDLEKVPHDALKHENSAQDILENSNTASSSSETNSPFCNFLSITGEIADLKNEQAPLHSFRDGVNINPGQKEAHNETSSIKGDENNCQSLKTGEVTGEKRTNKKTFKNDDNSNEFIECNPHKEGGEISSVEDYGLTPSEKSKNEEKEEGELSSSDSGDDSLPVKHCDTNDGKNVQGVNRLTKEDKQALPRARTDSSRDFPNKLIDERSNSRREYSSHAVQSAGLRRKLHESRKKKFPSTSKANSSKETSNLRVQNGSRSEKAAKKNNCIKKHNRDELLTEGQKHGKAQSSGTKDKRRNFIQSSQRQECKTEEKWKFLDKQNEKPSNSSQDAKKIKKRSESKSEIKSRRNIRSPRETDKIVPNKVELHQVSKRKETKKLRTPEDAAVDKDSREETQHSKTITCTKAKTTLHHQIVETETKSARPLSRQSEETLLRRTLSVDNFGSRKHVETKQGNTISHSTHCLEQSKTGNFSKREDEAKTTTTDIGKLNISGKRKTTPSKTASRVTTRNTPKKSLTANKRRTKPLNSSENPLQNPRKRIRPTESTEKWQTKKSRVDKQRNSSTTADTIEPNMSTKIVQCNTVKNGEIFYMKVKDSGNQMNPDKLEYFQLNKTEHNCQNNPTIKSVATRAEPILFGRNKCLVFKRRHVNQLFIRGDNVVMVGYAE